MKAVNPYLSFAGNAEEAFDFYAEVFDAEPLGVMRFRSLGEEVPGVRADELDLVAHIALPMGSDRFQVQWMVSFTGDAR